MGSDVNSTITFFSCGSISSGTATDVKLCLAILFHFLLLKEQTILNVFYMLHIQKLHCLFRLVKETEKNGIFIAKKKVIINDHTICIILLICVNLSHRNLKLYLNKIIKLKL